MVLIAWSDKAGSAPTFLFASEVYKTIHQYLQVCAEQAAKYHYFRSIRIKCLPHIKFMIPYTDMCQHLLIQLLKNARIHTP